MADLGFQDPVHEHLEEEEEEEEGGGGGGRGGGGGGGGRSRIGGNKTTVHIYDFKAAYIAEERITSIT